MDPEAPKKPVGGAYGCFLAQNPDGLPEAILGQTRICRLAARRRKVEDIDRGVV